jgi:hypothetical protein
MSVTRRFIKTECSSCGGTGLYQGFMEAKGEPVVCLSCEGTGCAILSYQPWTGRKVQRGVKVVRMSRGTFILTGVGARPKTEMTYEEFQKKFKPPKASAAS